MRTMIGKVGPVPKGNLATGDPGIGWSRFLLLLFCIKDRYLLILVEGFECHQDPVGLGWSGLPGKVAIVFGGRERLPFSTLVLWSYG